MQILQQYLLNNFVSGSIQSSPQHAIVPPQFCVGQVSGPLLGSDPRCERGPGRDHHPHHVLRRMQNFHPNDPDDSDNLPWRICQHGWLPRAGLSQFKRCPRQPNFKHGPRRLNSNAIDYILHVFCPFCTNFAFVIFLRVLDLIMNIIMFWSVLTLMRIVINTLVITTLFYLTLFLSNIKIYKQIK